MNKLELIQTILACDDQPTPKTLRDVALRVRYGDASYPTCADADYALLVCAAVLRHEAHKYSMFTDRRNCLNELADCAEQEAKSC